MCVCMYRFSFTMYLVIGSEKVVTNFWEGTTTFLREIASRKKCPSPKLLYLLKLKFKVEWVNSPSPLQGSLEASRGVAASI